MLLLAGAACLQHTGSHEQEVAVCYLQLPGQPSLQRNVSISATVVSPAMLLTLQQAVHQGVLTSNSCSTATHHHVSVATTACFVWSGHCSLCSANYSCAAALRL
eukprot:9816-Heterococcus_DN1.PRE.1